MLLLIGPQCSAYSFKSLWLFIDLDYFPFHFAKAYRAKINIFEVLLIMPAILSLAVSLFDYSS
jgi:hypothetical protein